MTVRVIIADDQQLVRAGFRLILERQTDVEVVGEAADGAQAVSLVREMTPDVVLMDIRMPEVDGIEATRRIRSDPDAAHVSIIMLTTFDMDEYVYEALRAGANGFLLKDLPPEQLVDAVLAVGKGETLLAPTVTRRLIEHFTATARTAQPPKAVDELTSREMEVLQRLALGRSNAEIGQDLFISENTVKTHVTRVLTKDWWPRRHRGRSANRGRLGLGQAAVRRSELRISRP
jgi:DNA-binding NarL/FixJ family response regulator